MQPTKNPGQLVGDFLAGYVPPSGFYDEMAAEAGRVRPHWMRFRAELAALGPEEFARRWRQAQRLLHENGLAYSAFGDPTQRTRPWELDPLPVLIPAKQWRRVSAALHQRAR